MQPTHQTSDRTMAEARLGPERLGGAYAWQTLAQVGRAAGVRVGLPGRIAQPLPRPRRRGQPPGPRTASRRAAGGRTSGSASSQALAGFTRGAAYAGLRRGPASAASTPGKYADFILVDRDVSQVAPGELARTQVLETWVAGKKVWAKNSLGERGQG